MRDAQARTVYLKDYRPPAFLVERTNLHFELFEDCALVKSTLTLRRNNDSGDELENEALVLHGQQLVLEKLFLNGRLLSADEYLVDSETLTVPEIEGQLGNGNEIFTLTCHTRIEPQNNTALEGLYRSGNMFCTQCEAEGFRRITYYPDRPDVMSVFTTTIVADREKYPVLLSNGNRVGEGVDENDSSRHWVSWHDPFKKPSYLFALVAGRLAHIEDSFVTCSGREITLRIFVESKDLDKCDHAMLSLKNAMRWDEEIYGREYDLDIFMIVAVDAFNMGAMENKGLNIFNTSCVLANPATTTDSAFQRVEAVVAHEYFHNWSGNRVTCRDWFQLSLKEGFTVFRDSEFSADMGSRTVKRIEDVTLLRTAQFAEDSGPMAHPVRPDSYMEISNFYTLTVYEKGAEVVRMISHILGPENFRKGTDLYFERHDGQAVTTEDFVQAMEDASGIDLGQFRNWYTQAGTPSLEVSSSYDAVRQEYALIVRQSCPPSPGQAEKLPFHIPLRMGLIDQQGDEMPLCLKGEEAASAASDRVIDITLNEQKIVFTNVKNQPVPSLLRGFSAPVRLNYAYSLDELYFLMVHDSDGFNRWNASQQLGVRIIEDLVASQSELEESSFPEILYQAFSGVLSACLDDPQQDRAMIAQLLSLPSESYLIELAETADVDAIHRVREFLANTLAGRLRNQFAAVYQVNQDSGPFSAAADAIAGRSLKNLALGYLVRGGLEADLASCREQFNCAHNMTDQHAALRLLDHCVEVSDKERGEVLEAFYRQWQHEPLVVDQWFTIQAARPLPGNLQHVETLMRHEQFNIRNPNKVRSVIGAFCGANHVNFHDRDGSGYRFLADQVLVLNKLNPQIASRLLTPLTRWKKFDDQRQQLMLEQLKRIKADQELSKDVFEVVEKSTAA
jgi:aminopeptidase N